MHSVEAALTELARLRTKVPGYAYSCVEDFVIANGQPFEPIEIPDKYRGSEPAEKQCYLNAFHLAERHRGELRYVEGYANHHFKPGVGIPWAFQHAWCIDRDNNVIDISWNDMTAQYYGVVFDFDYVIRTTGQRGVFGVLDNYQFNYPLVRGEHTEADWKPEQAA